MSDNPSDDKWVARFISAKGIPVLITVLQEKNMKKRKNALDVSVQVEVLKALEILIQAPRGLKELSVADTLRELVLILDSDDVPLKASMLHLLSFYCLSAGEPEKGVELILEAFNAYRRSSKGTISPTRKRFLFVLTNPYLLERKRFETVVESLFKVESTDYILHAVSLLNAVVNSPADIDKRTQLRSELESLKLSEALKQLSDTYGDHEELKEQIDIYNEEMEQDRKELAETAGSR